MCTVYACVVHVVMCARTLRMLLGRTGSMHVHMHCLCMFALHGARILDVHVLDVYLLDVYLLGVHWQALALYCPFTCC